MVAIHVGYFLLGVLIFSIFRLAEMTKPLGGGEIPRKDGSIIFEFALGGAWLLAAINVIINMSTVQPGLERYILSWILPLVILLFSAVLFGCIAFMAPTKNFLLALLIGTIVAIVMGILLNFIFELVILLEGYELFINSIVAVLIGVGIGLICYAILWKKNPSGNETLWEAKKFWRTINNKKFLIIFIIIVAVEAYLQMQLNSLLTIFV